MNVVIVGMAVLAGLSAALRFVGAAGRDRRSHELAALAERLGLEYTATDVFNDAWQPFRLFGLGLKRGVTDVISGTLDGAPVKAFGYWYREDRRDGGDLVSGPVGAVRRFSCAIVTLPASCPHLTVEKRDLGDDIMGLVDGELVELDLEAFDRRFAVRSQDRRFAVALLDQRMMEALMQMPPSANVAVAEDRLLVVAPQLPVEGVVGQLRSAAQIHRMIPAVLGSLYPLRPGSSDDIATAHARRSIPEDPEPQAPGLWWF